MINEYKISSQALQVIISESATSFPNETGGILVGSISDNLVVIELAIGPGPQSLQSISRF